MEVKMLNLLLVVVTCAALGHVKASRIVDAFEDLADRFDTGHQRIQELKKTVTDLSRQVMLQQFMVEEKTRSDGSSGIRLIRGGPKGLANYYSPSHTGNSFMSIHDHANYDRTIGMGEISAVLNGVDFRTRHNDFKAVMPAPKDDIDATQEIEYPKVPPEVLKQPNVKSQIAEMREWFIAFWTQNTTHRYYPDYFRPVITYLEGAWTLNKELKESFPSDRHKLDATTWFELQEKNRFSASSGVKEGLENLAILPTTIMEVNTTTGQPTYAQWNYRILGYPITGDLPLKYLQHVDDLSSRISRGQTRPEMLEKRSSRFTLYRGTDPENYGLLDEIMYMIPGKDNYYKNLSQVMFGSDGMYDFAYPKINVKLDTGRYHRWYKSAEKDAMGIQAAARSYNDDHCFVAQTTQPTIASIEMEECKRRTCVTNRNSFTYAIPLEIIFLTPLLTWNPYKLKIHKGLDIANKNNRDGRDSDSKAYDGVDSNHYYLTPAEFFSGTFVEGDPADTVRNAVYVKAPNGKRYKTSASGTQIILQSIPGLGRVRCRYPIAPVHGEGSSVWKELNALKDHLNGDIIAPPEEVAFVMESNGDHTHEFNVTYRDFLRMIHDRLPLTVVTEEGKGHTHEVKFRFFRVYQRFQYDECDGVIKCTDGHGKVITMLTKNVFTELPRPNDERR